MNISFVLPHGGRAGAVKSTVKVANGLSLRGHKVRLLVNSKPRSIRVKLRDIWWRIRYSDGSDWLNLFEGRPEFFRDITKCTFVDNEIVVASGWWAANKLKEIQGSAIIKVHHMRSMMGSEEEIAENWSEKVTKIIIGSFMKEPIERICNQKINAIIPNGIDRCDYYPVVDEHLRDGIGTIFGTSVYKDPEVILNVLGKMKQLFPNIPQRVFGAARKPQQIDKENYYRLPSLVDTRMIYSKSKVWFIGSSSEGFSVPILEAMACGCAVISTDCGGPRDIIKDGENGFLVNVADVDEITNRIQLLLNDEALRKKIVNNGYQTVNDFSWENSVDKMESLLLNLVVEKI